MGEQRCCVELLCVEAPSEMQSFFAPRGLWRNEMSLPPRPANVSPVYSRLLATLYKLRHLADAVFHEFVETLNI